MAKYDVIVVGAGLGGLAAAAKAAHGGLSVCLLERHTQPGGYATTFYREPFEFEVSLHELSGIGTEGHRGPLYRQLDELGVASRLTFVPIPELYRTVGDGLDLRLPADREGALQTLCDAFPQEHRGLRRLFAHFAALRQEVEALSAGDGPAPSVREALTKYPLVSHAAGCPASTLLYRELRDPRARVALGQLWSYFGLPPAELSLLYFAGGLTSLLTYGACYPKGKSQTLSNTLADVITRHGGEVRLGEGVRRIECADGAVTGVVTEHGARLEAPTIVANANPVSVALELIDDDVLPESFRGRLARTRPSISAFCVYLGLSRTAAELGMRDHEVFVNHTLDLEEQFRLGASLEPPDSFLITAYSVCDPEFSPPGTSVAVLGVPVDGETWMRVPRDDYHALKERWGMHLLERASRLYPDLARSVDVAVTSTPLTNLRYTGNIAGAIYGFAMTPAESPAFRLSPRGPLEGLTFAGAWTYPGGGYETSLSSGFSAGKQAIARAEELARDRPSAAAGARR